MSASEAKVTVTVDPASLQAAIDYARQQVEDITVARLERFAQAFALWEERYRDDPDRFLADWERVTTSTAVYGYSCAAYFVDLLRELADDDEQTVPEVQS